MTLIISEKKSITQSIKEVINKNSALKDELGKIDYFNFGYGKNAVFELTEKSNNRQYNISHFHHEYGAENTSDRLFPFNKENFNYEIVNQQEFDQLKELIEKHDVIISCFDLSRRGNIKFNSLVFSGYFNLANKKIFATQIESLVPDAIITSFQNKISIEEQNEFMKKNDTIDFSGLRTEIAINEFNWKDIDLDAKYEIPKSVLEKYSKKYNINLIDNEKAFSFKFYKNASNRQVLEILKSLVLDKSQLNI